jgi:hypothetical protein
MARSVCSQNGAIAVYAKQLFPQRDLRIKIPAFLPPQHHRERISTTAGFLQVLVQSRFMSVNASIESRR